MAFVIISLLLCFFNPHLTKGLAGYHPNGHSISKWVHSTFSWGGVIHPFKSTRYPITFYSNKQRCSYSLIWEDNSFERYIKRKMCHFISHVSQKIKMGVFVTMFSQSSTFQYFLYRKPHFWFLFKHLGGGSL